MGCRLSECVFETLCRLGRGISPQNATRCHTLNGPEIHPKQMTSPLALSLPPFRDPRVRYTHTHIPWKRTPRDTRGRDRCCHRHATHTTLPKDIPPNTSALFLPRVYHCVSSVDKCNLLIPAPATVAMNAHPLSPRGCTCCQSAQICGIESVRE